MKFYTSCVVTVATIREDGVSDVPAVEYNVRALGRGRWAVEDEDGYRRFFRTSGLKKFFSPDSYESGYYSSGEPVRVCEKVYITRTRTY